MSAVTRHGGASRIHGETPEYSTWNHMRSRCGRPGDKNFSRYGGRGIKVCDRWNDFANFLADMGIRPGKEYSLDRIDVHGNYEPGNCRWATSKTQNRNRANNVPLTAFGETKVQMVWTEDPRCVVSYATLRYRLSKGVSPETALTTPLKGKA